MLISIALVLSSARGENCSSSVLPKDWFKPLDASHGLLDWGDRPTGWGACQKYSRATCCSKEQTDAVFRLLVGMERAGFSSQCQYVTERLLCAVGCDADVGLGLRKPHVCLESCNEWFQACREEFFQPLSNVFKVPFPCLDNALVCSKAAEVYTDGEHFCTAMAIPWSEEESCLDGKLKSSERRGKAVYRESSSDVGASSLLNMLYRDVRMMSKWLNKMFGQYTASVDWLTDEYTPHLLVLLLVTVFVGAARTLGAQVRRTQRNDDFDE